MQEDLEKVSPVCLPVACPAAISILQPWSLDFFLLPYSSKVDPVYWSTLVSALIKTHLFIHGFVFFSEPTSFLS